jgi:hypothetical protein
MAETKDLYKWAIIENMVTIVGAILLSAFLVWFTKSLLGLLGLLVLMNLNAFKSRKTEAKCPKCGHEFVLSSDDDD